MNYYVTGPNSATTRAVLASIYEAASGFTLGVDETGQKIVPQNDGAIQCNYEFETWRLAGGGVKPGAHGLINIYPTEENPDGVISDANLAVLANAGIDVLSEDQIPAAQLALLPKFQ